LWVEEIDCADRLRSLEPIWGDLLDRSGTDSVFLTFEWLSTWWEHLGDGCQLRILVVKDDEQVVGLAPLMQIRHWSLFFPVRKVLFLGIWGSDRLDFIVPDRREEFFAAVVRHLREGPPAWDVWEVEKIPEDSPNLEALRWEVSRQGPFRHGFRPCFDSPFLPVEGSWDSYLRKPEQKKLRRTLQNRWNRLNRAGVPREIDSSDPSGVEEVFPQLVDLNVRAAKGRDALLASGARRGFYQEIARRFSPKGWLSVRALCLDDRLVAYDYSFVYKGAFIGYHTGFDPDYRALSPGKILQSQVIRSCFERGLREVDFSAGEEDYKSEWTVSFRRHVTFLVFSRGIRGTLLCFLYIKLLPGLERLGLRSVCRKLEAFRLFRSTRNRLAGIRGE